MAIKEIFESKKKYLLAIWTIFILVLTLAPLPDIPSSKIGYTDKVVHAVLFAVFAFLFYMNQPRHQPGKIKPYFISFFASAVFAGLIELLQAHIPGRSCDVYDFLAGSAGALFLLEYVYYWKKA